MAINYKRKINYGLRYAIAGIIITIIIIIVAIISLNKIVRGTDDEIRASIIESFNEQEVVKEVIDFDISYADSTSYIFTFINNKDEEIITVFNADQQVIEYIKRIDIHPVNDVYSLLDNNKQIVSIDLYYDDQLLYEVRQSTEKLYSYYYYDVYDLEIVTMYEIAR